MVFYLAWQIPSKRYSKEDGKEEMYLYHKQWKLKLIVCTVFYNKQD